MINKYNNFIIYKIYQEGKEDMVYIGSTTNFNQRKFNHKKNTTNKRSKKYKIKLYQYIRSMGGWDTFRMEIIETNNFESKGEGLLREKELIKEYGAKLNSINPIK
jgi:predicted GIY-YIG superfamily endonuclease